MTNTNATNFRKNMFSYLEQVTKFNEPVNIATKNGNAVILSEEDYRGMMETLYLESIEGMTERILRGKQAPREELVALGGRSIEDFIKDEL